ncbi:hypothetical protein Clacol_009095 [Clathrus columnatus]|uniref:Uncharacterized protein n=1 Tax=Clathrus columnatus TaxID=1419009 RepID=A0AAV5AM30_9AGAM|nr:hypothetical protein Clacol_009095 [Clathrus columnatus]
MGLMLWMEEIIGPGGESVFKDKNDIILVYPGFKWSRLLNWLARSNSIRMNRSWYLVSGYGGKSIPENVNVE